MSLMVEKWEPAKHLPLMRAWLEGHGMTVLPELDLLTPPVGFVVGGIVLGHLRLTDSAWAYMDNFISDPASEKAERRAAIRVLSDLLTVEARARGVLYLAGFTHHTSRIEDAHALGCYVSEKPYTFLLRRI